MSVQNAGIDNDPSSYVNPKTKPGLTPGSSDWDGNSVMSTKDSSRDNDVSRSEVTVGEASNIRRKTTPAGTGWGAGEMGEGPLTP